MSEYQSLPLEDRLMEILRIGSTVDGLQRAFEIEEIGQRTKELNPEFSLTNYLEAALAFERLKVWRFAGNNFGRSRDIIDKRFNHSISLEFRKELCLSAAGCYQDEAESIDRSLCRTPRLARMDAVYHFLRASKISIAMGKEEEARTYSKEARKELEKARTKPEDFHSPLKIYLDY